MAQEIRVKFLMEEVMATKDVIDKMIDFVLIIYIIFIGILLHNQENYVIIKCRFHFIFIRTDLLVI